MSASWSGPPTPTPRELPISPRELPISPRELPISPRELPVSPREVAGPARDLAARQSELVAALVAGGPAPAGFDTGRLDATRRALLRKRAGEAAGHWPLLAAAWGAEWPHVFATLRDGHGPVGALRDGWDVARTLRDRGELPDGAVRELAEREAALSYDGRTAPRARRLRRALTRLRRSR